MPLVNLRYAAGGRFFWDWRAETLEQQVLMPIESPEEMGHQLAGLVGQLSTDPIYPPLFERAFGDAEINRDRLAAALAQFVRSIVSFGSAYDAGLATVNDAQDDFPNLSDQENFGKSLFFEFDCAKCHLPDVGETSQSTFFQTVELLNNGLDIDDPSIVDRDRGRGGVTKDRADDGKFKSSSLRNIEVTGPYMHDGRFVTLDAVIEHYNWSVKPVDNLDPRLEEFAAGGRSLPEREKQAVLAFLRTLTDTKLLTTPRYGNPWQ